jgi:hypothetical protein
MSNQASKGNAKLNIKDTGDQKCSRFRPHLFCPPSPSLHHPWSACIIRPNSTDFPCESALCPIGDDHFMHRRGDDRFTYCIGDEHFIHRREDDHFMQKNRKGIMSMPSNVANDKSHLESIGCFLASARADTVWCPPLPGWSAASGL